MTDRLPPFSVSERASASAALERSYRRFVALYPRSFRRENTEEIIAVLLATADETQRRPTVAESFDLLRGAARMRLGLSHCPRTVLHAVRLMYLGALAEVALLITLLLTADGIRAAVRAAIVHAGNTHQAHATVQRSIADVSSLVDIGLTANVVIMLLGIAGFLFLAWANSKGSAYARVGAIIVCAFYTAAEVMGLSQGNAAVYAPAATIASLIVAVIGIASVVLLLMKPSWPYYAGQHATQATSAS